MFVFLPHCYLCLRSVIFLKNLLLYSFCVNLFKHSKSTLFENFLLVFSNLKDGSEDANIFTKGNRSFNRFLLFIPAMCDMTATSLMYIGLNLTYAASFQMLRGNFFHVYTVKQRYQTIL